MLFSHGHANEVQSLGISGAVRRRDNIIPFGRMLLLDPLE